MGINYKIINLTRGQEMHSAGSPWRLSDIELEVIIALMKWKETDLIELYGLAAPCNNYIYEGHRSLGSYRMEALIEAPTKGITVRYACLLLMKVLSKPYDDKELSSLKVIYFG